MKKIKTTLLTLATVFGTLVAPLVPVAVHASPVDDISGGVKSIDKNAADPNTTDLTSGIKNIVNVMLYLLGAIAVIMIIIGGFRYVTSGGDSSQTKSAKDTILYAVIGIIVAILAYAIVNFVLSNIGKK